MGGALRRLHAAADPPRTGALLRLFPRLTQVRQQRAQLKLLVRRAHQFTPAVASEVATLARFNPDAALTTFARAFQREHFELDETVCEQGFDFWVDAASQFIPMLMRGTDRCNGIEPLAFRPGFALMWALIENVFYGNERAEVIAEVAGAFGNELADRLEQTDPPEHSVLRLRVARTPYLGMYLFFPLGARRRHQSPYLNLGRAPEYKRRRVHVNDVEVHLRSPGCSFGAELDGWILQLVGRWGSNSLQRPPYYA